MAMNFISLQNGPNGTSYSIRLNTPTIYFATCSITKLCKRRYSWGHVFPGVIGHLIQPWCQLVTYWHTQLLIANLLWSLLGDLFCFIVLGVSLSLEQKSDDTLERLSLFLSILMKPLFCRAFLHTTALSRDKDLKT